MCWGKGIDYWETRSTGEESECLYCFGTGIQEDETLDNGQPQDLNMGQREE